MLIMEDTIVLPLLGAALLLVFIMAFADAWLFIIYGDSHEYKHYRKEDDDDSTRKPINPTQLDEATKGGEAMTIEDYSIMDNYKEIELPQRQWHDGDILVCKRYPNCYAVFKKYDVNDTFDAYFIYDNKNTYLDATAFAEAYRLASAKDIEGLPRLFSYLMAYLNDAGLCLPKARLQTK